MIDVVIGFSANYKNALPELGFACRLPHVTCLKRAENTFEQMKLGRTDFMADQFRGIARLAAREPRHKYAGGFT